MTNRLAEENVLNRILISLEATNRVSDVHIKSGSKIRYREIGDIKTLEGAAIDGKNLIAMMQEIFNEKIKTDFKDNKQADFGFATSNNTRYRANLFCTNTGCALSLRRIDNKILTFEQIGLPPIIKKIAGLQKGLVIISGPTGSGKSTTLNSIIDFINENYRKHIITVEDPIEFIHQSKQCLINQREIGVDAKSFSLAIKSALREDPDIILLGEIRDAETIKECLTAAETGHLVLATMHTVSAAKSIDRIVDTCSSVEKDMVRTMLSSSLQAVILQKLLRKKDGSGRVCAFEILLGTNAVRNLIKENKIEQIDSMIQTGSKYGMVDMTSSMTALYKSAVISMEEFNENSINLGKVDDW
ncbi:MAG: PilT/PilU family type 4a pilus ATPase [Rickettsiales bacterium]|jgi:twitching motility protein PilT|nr:PilT/PilU family type 4a pilus ATPase [Rickettsiales bacterium]